MTEQIAFFMGWRYTRWVSASGLFVYDRPRDDELPQRPVIGRVSS